MSFEDAESWPGAIVDRFERAVRDQFSQSESRYYGPWNVLLHYVFVLPGFRYMVAPQSPTTDGSRDAVDFITYLVMNPEDKPVLFVEVKDDSSATTPDLRFQADAQMRDRYKTMLARCPISCLWGISAMGPLVRIYCGDRETRDIHPAHVERPDADRILPPDFLAGEWSLDVTSPQGFNKMEIVGDIKAEALLL